MVSGDRLEVTYLWYGLSASTRSSYQSVVRSYSAFCRLKGKPSPYFPASATDVSVWIAHMALEAVTKGKGLFKATLKRKVAGLVSFHTDLGFPVEPVTSARVERVIRGANRYHGVQERDQALPITLPILRRMVAAIRANPRLFGGDGTAACLIATFTLGFACFMRMGELTYSHFDAEFDLKRSAIKFNHGTDEPHTLTIASSKTDPFRRGVTVVIPEGPSDVCPVRALFHHMSLTNYRHPESPLFAFPNGGFPKDRVVKYMSAALRQAGYAAPGYTGHSLRRGAATWAASIGLSATEIKTLGRWNSDCYKLYIDAAPSNVARVGEKLLTASEEDSSLPNTGIPRPGQVWRPAV